MGYSLIGPGSGTVNGITMSGRSNVEIPSGTVRGFYGGIRDDGANSSGQRVVAVRSIAKRRYGIDLNSSKNLVKDCTVSDNGTSADSTVYGIFAFNNSRVTGNIVSGNGNAAASDVYGIEVYGSSTITDNTSEYNGRSSTGEIVYGIKAGQGSTVTNNTANGNGSDASGTSEGIHLDGDNLVDLNTTYNNGTINMSSCATCVFGTNLAP